MIDISKLSKVAVLVALYNAAKTQGLGVLHYDPAPMSEEEATQLLEEDTHFDYLHGRVLKIDLSGSQLDPRLYDRDNGQGKAERIISNLAEV